MGDLARVAGSTTRSVRTYQESGLLPPPTMRGRTGWYSDDHLGRLRLIMRLQQQGFTFAAIGVLLQAWESGRDVAEVLGLESAVSQPWDSEEPAPVTLAQLQERLHGQLTPALLQRLIQLRVVSEAESGYLLASPALLQSAEASLRMGIPLPVVLDLGEGLKADLRNAADRIVRMVGDHILRDTGPDGLPTGDALAGAAEVVNELRPQAQVAVDLWFVRGMDAAIAQFVADLMRDALPPAMESDPL